MKTQIYCHNDTFKNLPISFDNRELPKANKEYAVSYQLVDDGELYVELEEITGLMFNFNQHFILLNQ
jgi:hypothetical protein